MRDRRLPVLIFVSALASVLASACGDDSQGNDNQDNANLSHDATPGDGSAGDAAVERCEGGQDEDGDGLVDCDDPDCREAPACVGQVETDCSNGLDDDGDGLVDCADPSCGGVGICEVVEVTCDDGLDNDGDGLADCLDRDCDGRPGCTGVETNCENGLDDDGDGRVDCADPDCAGRVICEYPEGRCADGFDNDGDGLVDCADPDCDGRAGCELAEASCDDGQDNDGDGLTDCADPDCDGIGACEPAEVTCGDGFDNDGDGLTDCADPGCDGLPCGEHGRLCSGGACLCPGGEVAEASCGDGQDNDCDGLADCDDPDCFGGPGCTTEANCGDLQDNDGDGLTDCADPDCGGVGACEVTEATCDDGFDNDGDGLTDCADPSCAGASPCEATEVTCDDGFDNDGDGLTDCADPSCAAQPCGPHGRLCGGALCRCPSGLGTELACGDGLDDDCDGLVDCADPDCAGQLFCTRTGETCATAKPLLGPGTVIGTTAGFAADLSPGASCTPLGATGPDRVYAITVQAGQELHATLTPTGGWQAALYLARSCTTLGSGCLAASDTGGVETLQWRAPSTGTVYLVVDGRGPADAGDFQLVVSLTETGDSCADPAVISQPSVIQGTTVGMANDLDPGAGGCTGQAAPGADRVYRVDLTYGYSLIATLQPVAFDGALYVLSACADAATSCLSGADAAGVGGTEVAVHTCDTAAETVYLVVDGHGAAGGTFTLDVDITEAGNDTCLLPALLPDGPATYQGDLGVMTNDYDPTVGWSCIAGAAPGPDAVYYATLDAGQSLTATLIPSGPPAWDGALYVMIGDCSDPASCALGQDSALAGGQERLVYYASGNGTPVYLVVDSLYVGQGAGYTLHTFVQ